MAAAAPGTWKVDHITVNVRDLRATQRFFVEVLGFEVFAHFNPETAISGMISTVVRRGDLKIAINEGTNPKSQISEFVAKHGEGVQHIAVHVDDIDACIAELKGRGVEFLTEILEDRDEFGRLRQCFTRPIMGGLFLEFIQRDGARGFGQGNVQRLYDAVEEAQYRGGGISRE